MNSSAVNNNRSLPVEPPCAGSLGREGPSVQGSAAGQGRGKECGKRGAGARWGKRDRGGLPRKAEHKPGDLGGVSGCRRGCKEPRPEVGTCVECPRAARRPGWMARAGWGAQLDARAGTQIPGASKPREGLYGLNRSVMGNRQMP